MRSSRDKCSLDLFWLRDESLEDSASLPDPHILAQEIADDLRSALGQIEDILGDLEERALGPAERSRGTRGSSGARGTGGAAAGRRGRSGG
jgi:type I restriction enzyme M protein